MFYFRLFYILDNYFFFLVFFSFYIILCFYFLYLLYLIKVIYFLSSLVFVLPFLTSSFFHFFHFFFFLFFLLLIVLSSRASSTVLHSCSFFPVNLSFLLLFRSFPSTSFVSCHAFASFFLSHVSSYLFRSFLFFFQILSGLLSMFLPLLSGIPGTSPLLRFSLPLSSLSLSRLFRGLVSLALIFLHSLLCIREGSFYIFNWPLLFSFAFFLKLLLFKPSSWKQVWNLSNYFCLSLSLWFRYFCYFFASPFFYCLSTFIWYIFFGKILFIIFSILPMIYHLSFIISFLILHYFFLLLHYYHPPLVLTIFPLLSPLSYFTLIHSSSSSFSSPFHFPPLSFTSFLERATRIHSASKYETRLEFQRRWGIRDLEALEASLWIAA